MSTPPAFPQLPAQRGLATVGQLRAVGFTVGHIRHARATRWQSPLPGVLAPHRRTLDRSDLLVAAALWAGPRAFLTGRLALAVRAFVDAAQYEGLVGEQAEDLAIATLQRGLGSPEALEADLWQRPAALVGGLRQGLAAFREGAWSRPEAALRKIVAATPGLPEFYTNCRLETPEGDLIAIPDGYLAAAGTAIQVHSRTYHQGPDREVVTGGPARWSATPRWWPGGSAWCRCRRGRSTAAPSSSCANSSRRSRTGWPARRPRCG